MILRQERMTAPRSFQSNVAHFLSSPADSAHSVFPTMACNQRCRFVMARPTGTGKSPVWLWLGNEWAPVGPDRNRARCWQPGMALLMQVRGSTTKPMRLPPFHLAQRNGDDWSSVAIQAAVLIAAGASWRTLGTCGRVSCRFDCGCDGSQTTETRVRVWSQIHSSS